MKHEESFAKETGDTNEKIPSASVRVGIDTGRALVVNNGRSGNREPLFFGRPANNAAKIAGHQNVVGIFLSNEARKAPSTGSAILPSPGTRAADGRTRFGGGLALAGRDFSDST